MTNLVTVKSPVQALAMTEDELCEVLANSVYPGAKLSSIKLVINVCKAAGKDPLKKPYHIVPMSVPTGRKTADGWDEKEMRDVIMSGINDYRTDAARTGRHAGTSEPEFGPDVTATLDGVTITYPAWCRVVVRRILDNGVISEFPVTERWTENYATKSSKSAAPNSMWRKRPYAQLAKCAEAGALRKAFPEVGSQPTAEEAEGKEIDVTETVDHTSPPPSLPRRKSDSPKAEEMPEPSAPKPTFAPSTDDLASEAWMTKLRALMAAQNREEAAVLEHFDLPKLEGITKAKAIEISKWLTAPPTDEAAPF